MGTFIAFGQKGLNESPGGRMPGPTTDALGIVVYEDPKTVADALAATDGFVRFERAWAGDRYPVHVRAANVWFLQEQEVRGEG